MSIAMTPPAPSTPSRRRVPAESMTLPISADQATESHRGASSATLGHDQGRPAESHWESIIDSATD